MSNESLNFLEGAIKILKNKRQLFHSEDDLKLALSLVIKEQNPEYEIRLEKPASITIPDIWNNKHITRAPIDIVVRDNNGAIIPIELKYKTNRCVLEADDEIYNLTQHGAIDEGRFNIRKDIFRIECFVNENQMSSSGYVFILTNDSKYYLEKAALNNTLDKNFSCHDNAIINKNYEGWNYSNINRDKYDFKNNCWVFKNNHNKKHWTCSKQFSFNLELNKNYEVKWNNYSKPNNIEFMYCLFKITP